MRILVLHRYGAAKPHVYWSTGFGMWRYYKMGCDAGLGDTPTEAYQAFLFMNGGNR